VRIFKNTWFTRFANKEAINDDELRDVVECLDSGQAEVDLGGGVFKVRIARPGVGKAGGFRLIVCFKNGDRAFFRYGFAKSARDNIDKKELQNHRRAAKFLLALNDEQLDALVKTGQYIEIEEA
jgi:hypothetical protein